jgi:DNA-binding SARP family transcriptional activator
VGIVAPSAPLHLELLGAFRVLGDDRPTARQLSLRQQQIITFLALHARSSPIPRQRVAGSLWPESSDVQALTNLRRELHHLRESWPRLNMLILAGTRTLGWQEKTGASVDLFAFEDASDRGLEGDRSALLTAARLYKGDLVPGCAGEWIDADRERLRQRAKKVLEQLVTLSERELAFGDAIDSAQQLLRIDPLDEQAWCALMRSHARRGERATALHVYQQCAATLRKELGVQPSAATRVTYREILDVDQSTPVAPSAPRTGVYPLVGRQREWQALLGAWRRAAEGGARCFLIRGEAGIGKTRLAEELIDWCRLNGVRAAAARCYAGEGRLAYAPVAAWLRSDAVCPALSQMEPSSLAELARLRPDLLNSRPDAPPPDSQLERWQRLRLFEALAHVFRSSAPIVLAVDDLQWADDDTLECLQYFLRSASDARCLVVGTLRAEEQEDNPRLGQFLALLERERLLTAITLGPLDRTATGQLAGEVAEHPLDEAALARTFRESEGHPLFIVERGQIEQTAGASDQHTLPHVQSVVAARLAALSQEARTTAEIAAAVGRDFRFDVLARASDLEEGALVRALDELWRRRIVRVQADERWDFSHDRIREVAYSEIGPARRRLIHRRIAQAMELLFANQIDDVSALIAMHLDRGGQPARAVPFLERAAASATRVSAVEEAIRCLTQALTLVEALPEGRDRDVQEIGLRSSLSVALNFGRGYAAPEVEQNLDRMFVLSRGVRGGPVPARWLWLEFSLRFVRGELNATRAVAEKALAYSLSDSSYRCEGHHAMGGVLQCLGELGASKTHFDAALAAYDEDQRQRSVLGPDLGVFTHAWYSHTLWLLGDERGALAHAEQGVALARQLEHVFSETLALAYAALLHQMRLDVAGVLSCAEAVKARCERYGFAYYGDWAGTLIGWARGLDHPAEGVSIIEAALERLDRNLAQARRPYYLSLLAETYSRMGNRDRAASINEAAIAMALDRADLWWVPALYLQKSERQSSVNSQEAFRLGLDLARAQGSRGLEQRLLSSPIAGTLSRTV